MSRVIATWVAWLQQRLTLLATRPLREYYQCILYENQIFDVKGISTRTLHDLDLEHVFVELNVDPKPTHQASADPLKVPEPLRQGSHTIWDYLSSSSLGDQHFVVVGAPGCGKTTLLKHLALTLARYRQPQNCIYQTIPILLYLREHANAISDNPTFSLLDAVQNHLQRWQRPQSPQWLAKFLAQGRCLILLDGLDEVANEELRTKTTTWVKQQITLYGEHNRFLITSRPQGYRTNPIYNAILLEIHPFTAQQTARFVQNWYLANELKSWGKDDPGIHMRAKQGAQDLLHRLHHSPALLALAVNPLLLTMITTVHRHHGSLPSNRVALYAQICEVFLGKHYEARSIAQQLKASQKQYVLQPLAYYLMQQERRDVTLKEVCEIIQPYMTHVGSTLSPQAFVSMIEQTSGLLLERDPNRYAFAHLTFQEYLASVHIKECDLEPVLTKLVEKSWWYETIRLYCAQANASRLISACLSKRPASVQTLTLALECYEEALLIDPHVRAKIATLLKTGVEDPDPERRDIIADALLNQRLNRMIQLHDETYIDTSLVTCAEYQLFLDEQSSLGKFYQPDHWLTQTFTHNQGHTPVLGVRSSDATAFCTWLTERDRKGWSYRLPTAAEHRQLEDDRSLAPELIPGRGYWIDEGSSFAWIGDKPVSFNDARQMIQTQFKLDSTLDLARPLANLLGLARIPTRDLAFDLPYPRALDLDLAHALAHTLDFDLDADLDLDLAHALAHDRAIDVVRVSTLDLARAHARDLARDLDLVRTPAYLPEKDLSNRTPADQEALFQPLRVRALMLVHLFDYWDAMIGKIPSSSKTRMRHLLPGKHTSYRHKLLENLGHSYLDLYISLVLLKLRIERKIPPWEGILLVKEHL